MKTQKLFAKMFLILGLLLLSAKSFSRNPNFYIYICFGQSNMEGQGAIEAQDKTVDSRFKVLQSLDCTSTSRTKGNWYPALPPLCLCDKGLTPADYFGRTMVQYLPDSITIGVINVSVGGCDIRLFDKDLYQNYVAVPNETWFTSKIKVYDGNPRKHLMDLARLAQQDGVIKGILMHQGEANLGDTNWPLYVKKVYNDMLNELSLGADTVPLLSGEVLYSGVYRDMNTIVRQLPNTIPTAHVISAAGCSAMDVAHFSSEGYRIIGKRYAAKMLSLMGISVDETALGIALKNPINPGSTNLTHQWTFDDGTAKDVVGTANGTLKGGATIANGVLMTDAAGQYLELPASQLGITSYPALSFETWFKSKSGANTGNTMLCYIGDTYSGKGSNGFFLSVARADNTSRVSISCGNTTAPWSAESYAGSAEFDDGLLHQTVGVITSSNITYYVDGIKQTTSALSASNSLANIKLNYAYLAKSGYTADPTWLGSIDKFSLYNKALSDEEVLYLFQNGIAPIATDVQRVKNEKIKLYSNPAGDYISLSGISGNANVEIMDLQGKVLLKDSNVISNQPINVQKLAFGSYLVKISTQDETVMKKILHL
ncbi:MAG TPA: sialate O-acetylesterase [Paludibacter sp.]